MFNYDKEKCYQHGPPEIVILAGPHKTASTTLQDFAVHLAAQKASVDKAVPLVSESHPSVEDWVWPVPIREDLFGNGIVRDSFRFMRRAPKTYAIFAAWVSGRRLNHFLRLSPKNTAEQVQSRLIQAQSYFRQLNRRVWEEQRKNILIGAEALDGIQIDLDQVTKEESEGEALHFSPNSEKRIDRLLSVFQWESTISSRPPPSLKDMEVHINLRLPRAGHLVSIWHQLGTPGEPLSEFLNKKNVSFYQMNSLGLALVFARKGIKTTVVDMTGLKAYANERQHSSDDDELIGGL